MANDLSKFPAGSLDIGVDAYETDFHPDLELDIDSYNLTSGIYRGIGPRYGMAPLPGHQDTEAPISSETNGLRRSEGSGANGLTYRTKVFAILPIRMINQSDYKQTFTAYAWIVGVNDGTSNGKSLSLCFSSTFATGPIYTYTNDIRNGLSPYIGTATSVNVRNYQYYPLYGMLTGATGGTTYQSKAAKIVRFLSLTDLPCYTRGYVSTATLAVSGRDVPMPWCVGDNLVDPGTATTAPGVNFWVISSMNPTIINCGAPSFYEMQNWKKKDKSIALYTLTVDGNFNIQYTLSFSPTSDNLLTACNSEIMVSFNSFGT